MKYYRLKKPWLFSKVDGIIIDGVHAENFGRGSIARVIFRKELSDVIYFIGRRGRKLGCAIYDFRSDMIFESVKRYGSKWIKCKGPDLNI